MKRHSRLAALAMLAMAAVVSTAAATDVTVAGLYSGKALVVINGGKPRVMKAGEASPEGVKLISADSESATLLIDGRKQTLRLGQAGKGGGGGRPTLALTADGRGQFSTHGTINGQPVRFLVDTGATIVALSATDAARLGINYRDAPRGAASTAGGVVGAYRVTLNNVSVGPLSASMVEASIIEGPGMPIALLGMSFLNRMEMNRDGDRLTLTQRY